LKQMNQNWYDQQEKKIEDFRVFKLHSDFIWSKIVFRF
jgi:hypothetical protein